MNKKIEVCIEKLIPGGKGLARVDGKVVFVPFVLPGEIVEIVINKEKKNYSEADLISIIRKSANRVEPECEYYYECGGCNMQHISYDVQLEEKILFAKNLLERNGGIIIKDIDIIPSKPFNYRNRIQVHLSGQKKCFKRRASNESLEINSCPVATGGVNRFLSQKKNISTENERLTVFGKENWFSIENDKDDIHIKLNNKNIYFNSKLFFQSNISILPMLSDYLNNHVEGDTLLDLYCGVGVLSSMVEGKFKKIITVEINKHVGPFLSRNLSIEHEFFPMSLEKWIKGRKMEKQADTIIIDPPRTGLSKTVREFLNKSKAGKIIYVSCDPATMARDLKDIMGESYKVHDFKLFDFYPQTSHMEAVAVLNRI